MRKYEIVEVTEMKEVEVITCDRCGNKIPGEIGQIHIEKKLLRDSFLSNEHILWFMSDLCDSCLGVAIRILEKGGFYPPEEDTPPVSSG